jgi:hypothetical protein
MKRSEIEPPPNCTEAIPIFSPLGLLLRDRVVLSETESRPLEEICSGEWLDWYRLSPQERLRESGKMWAAYLALGGSLDPEPDTQSPFYDPEGAS